MLPVDSAALFSGADGGGSLGPQVDCAVGTRWTRVGQCGPYKAPASVTAKHKTWHHYIRRYTSTVEAKGEIEQELLGLTAKVPFDDRFQQAARVDDLSLPLMLGFLREVGSELADDAPALPAEVLGRQIGGAEFSGA